MQVRPQIDDGLVAWTVDRDGLPWTVDDRLVQSVQYAGDGFGTPRQIGEVPVIGKAVSSGEGNRDTAVVLVETDTNVWTETDREVRKFTSEDQESGWTEQSAADAIGSPAAASGVTAWIGSNNGNETIRVTIDDGPVTTLATAAEIQSVTAATFSGDPLVTWAEERGNETLVRGRRYTGESWLDPGTAERVGANLSDLEVSVDQQSERLVGTYTIPESPRQSRTVRYFSVQFATEVDDERATTEVPVDVMPGEENVIDPDDETVEVVVFGGEVFDAKTVVDRVESVRFGSSDELDSGGGVGPRDDATDAGRVEDINGDGTPDLVIEFAVPDNRTISLEQVVIDTPAVRYVGTADVRFEPRETDESPPASEKTDSSERSDDDDFPWVWVLGAGGLLALFLYYARGRVDGRTDQPESG
jgi:hypothetical protein